MVHILTLTPAKYKRWLKKAAADSALGSSWLDDQRCMAMEAAREAGCDAVKIVSPDVKVLEFFM